MAVAPGVYANPPLASTSKIYYDTRSGKNWDNIPITNTAATSEIFFLAFRSLPKAERTAVVSRLLTDPEFREDLIDIAVMAQRENEPSRPYEEFVHEMRRSGRL